MLFRTWHGQLVFGTDAELASKLNSSVCSFFVSDPKNKILLLSRYYLGLDMVIISSIAEMASNLKSSICFFCVND